MSCRILCKTLTSSYIGKCDILHRLKCRDKTPGIFFWAGEDGHVIFVCGWPILTAFNSSLYGWRILYKPGWRPGINLERYNKLQLVRYSNCGGWKGVREEKWEIWKVTRSCERSSKNVGCKDKGDSGGIGGIRIITYDNIFVGQTHLGNYWISNNGGSSIVKVAEHCFGSLWIYVICQIMVRERLQITSWDLASEKYTDERFWLTVKMWRFRSFHGNMKDWTFHRCCLSLLKTSSDNFQYGQFCSLHRVCHQSIYLYITCIFFISLLLLDTSFFSSWRSFYILALLSSISLISWHRLFRVLLTSSFQFIFPFPSSFRHCNTILFLADRKHGLLAWWPLTTNRRSFVLGQSRSKNSPGFPDVSSLAVTALITRKLL